mgnify:CR=1 FL=1
MDTSLLARPNDPRRLSLSGAPLEAATGITLGFTPWAVILAEAFVALPFFVLAVESGLRSLDTRYLEVAATLGADPARRFRSITLPLIAPAVRAGLLVVTNAPAATTHAADAVEPPAPSLLEGVDPQLLHALYDVCR